MAFWLNPIVILGTLLTLSVVGNGIFYKLHTHDLQQIGSLKQAAKDARADAKACSDGVKRLREAANVRDRRVAEVLKDAEAQAHIANDRADRTLQERPASGDTCESALALNQRKLRERHP